MKQLSLRIVLALALILLPLTPMEVYADDGAEGIYYALVLIGSVVLFVNVLLMPLNGDGQEGDNRLAEQLKQLEPIENVVPQTSFTPTENANVHGAMYPVFEW